MITETTGKKGSIYTEYTVSKTGEVEKKGTTLTSLELISEEVGYGTDLNNDGSIGLFPVGDRSDYGSGATKVYEISGVGHGILANDSNYLTPLTDSKGNVWNVATPIGVEARATGTGCLLYTSPSPRD